MRAGSYGQAYALFSVQAGVSCICAGSLERVIEIASAAADNPTAKQPRPTQRSNAHLVIEGASS